MPKSAEDNTKADSSAASGYLMAKTMVNSPKVAKHIAKTLVREQIVACGQVVPRVTSYYWWQGKLESTQEYMLLLKLRASNFAALEKRLKELHPYELPELCAFEFAQISKDFKQWIEENSK